MLRWGIVLFIVAVVVFCIIFYNVRSKPIPSIDSITPPVGSPGDVVVIKGSNFGDIQDMNYVEIAGSRLTKSSYISWEDDCIKLVLPANVQDGLVYVGTKDRRSEPVLFANEVDIPVPVEEVQQVVRPVITGLSSVNRSVGDLLIIYGSNFGDQRNNSKVMFSTNYNRKINSESSNIEESWIAACEDDFDYISWSNNEIKVHIPDGACTGRLYVDTGKEKSDYQKINIDDSIGIKTFGNKKIFLIQYTADLDDIVTDGNDATITLRCPVPYKTVAQPSVEITEVNPEPVIKDYQKNIIHQLTKAEESSKKKIFKQTFVLPVYEINTSIYPDKIGYYKYTDENLLNATTNPDKLVPSDNEGVIKLAKKIIGKESNPYRKARKIYNYMCENFSILSDIRGLDADPLDLISTNTGDAYDFAVIYTALLRAVNVPAVTDAGILVSRDLTTQAHWWCEFYVDKVGWVPVDPALGAGFKYNDWNDLSEETREYYFGNLDSHHIVFTKGWKQLKPFSADNKIVQNPRSYALQSIWEEASSNVNKYSSYWSVPVVKGVY